VKKPNYFQINSIVKTFHLIELLVSQKEFELTDLNRLLNFTKTTTHRILLTLKSLGYVEQDKENMPYRASIKFFELGWRVIHNINLIEIAHPYMVELVKEADETVNLGILDGLDIICVHKVESKHILKQDQPEGSRSKAYYTAFGKAALAFLPAEELKRLLSEAPIVSSTSKSLKTVKDIEKTLKEIRDLGYSVDDEEFAEGIRCVGAPIFSHGGKIVAGMSIAGPTVRIKKQGIEHLAKLVMVKAAAISRRLGGRLPDGSSVAI